MIANPARAVVLAHLLSQLGNACACRVDLVVDVGMNGREAMLVGVNDCYGAGDRRDGEKGGAEAEAG